MPDATVSGETCATGSGRIRKIICDRTAPLQWGWEDKNVRSTGIPYAIV
jgi:hypothetical protein